jgi:hypothetical protein
MHSSQEKNEDHSDLEIEQLKMSVKRCTFRIEEQKNILEYAVNTDFVLCNAGTAIFSSSFRAINRQATMITEVHSSRGR